jgi:hypothetical protein
VRKRVAETRSAKVQPAASSVFLRFSIDQHGLLAHRRRQIELFLAMRVAVIDGGGGDARQRTRAASADDDPGAYGIITSVRRSAW